MKIKILYILSVSILSVAWQDQSKDSIDRSDPVWVVNQIFEAARTQQFEILTSLCDPKGENDRDTRNICAVVDSSDDIKASFVDQFKLGRVVGEAFIEGDKARVNLKFGPNGDRDETMNLIKRNDYWYLSSF